VTDTKRRILARRHALIAATLAAACHKPATGSSEGGVKESDATIATTSAPDASIASETVNDASTSEAGVARLVKDGGASYPPNVCLSLVTDQEQMNVAILKALGSSDASFDFLKSDADVPVDLSGLGNKGSGAKK
jgi:hypothetical protein